MFKKLVLIGLITASVVTKTALATGVPVVDVAGLAQAVLQVEEARKRLVEAKNQVQAVTGNAGLGGLISDPSVRSNLNKYLPKGYTDISQAMNKGDLGALQSLYSKVKQNEAQFEGKGKERLAVTLLVNQAQMDGLLKTIDTRNSKIDGIISQLNYTTDMSSKADLTNALQAEQGLITSEMNRMSVLMKQAEMQKDLAERQAASDSKKLLMGARPH